MHAIQARAVRVRIAQARTTQEMVARRVGIHPSLLSRYLRGHRSISDSLLAAIHHEIDRLEMAERAAADARTRVLARGVA